VVHALWTGFMHYRRINPEALSADTFGQAVRWLLAGQKPVCGKEHDHEHSPVHAAWGGMRARREAVMIDAVIAGAGRRAGDRPGPGAVPGRQRHPGVLAVWPGAGLGGLAEGVHGADVRQLNRALVAVG
jgi:hypothetical protein